MVNEIKTKKKHRLFSRQQAINPETGELTNILMLAAPKEVDKDFTKIFHAFTEALIQDEEISGKAIRLLFWIMKQLEMDRVEFYMNYKTIKEELNIGEATYHRWKKTLEKKGIIRKIGTNLYQINPACVFKGTGHSLLNEFKNQQKEN